MGRRSKTFGIVFGTTSSNRTVTHGLVIKTSSGIWVSPTGAKDTNLTIGSDYLWADGVRHTMDMVPYIRINRTFMPVRFASEALGAAVDWDPDKRPVIITKDSTKIVLIIGPRTMRLNNTNLTLDGNRS
ncbi:MAG: copper amine oxidase N-terminal domain-containing protein [Bacillota bacterium]